MKLLTANRMNELGLKNQRLKINILAERLKNAIDSIQKAENLIESQNKIVITELSSNENEENRRLTSSLVEIKEHDFDEDQNNTENSNEPAADTMLISKSTDSFFHYRGLLF